MKKHVLCGVLMAALPLVAQAMPVTWDNEKPIPFSQIDMQPIAADKGRAVFYRLPDALDEQSSVNLGIDGRLQTSLRAGNYTYHSICAGVHKVSSIQTGMKSNDLEKLPKYTDIDNKNEFFRVTVLPEGVLTEQVPAEVALEQIEGLQLQSHAVHRTSDIDCSQPVAAQAGASPATTAAPAATMSALPIEAVFFFDFDNDELDQAELARADQLVTELSSLQEPYLVSLSGYADPYGSDLYNNSLSARRAQSVGMALVNRGVDASLLRVNSFGETPKYAPQCASMSSDEMAKQCNRENRRVNVVIAQRP